MAPGGYGVRGALHSSHVSAQDLICLDMGKEIQDGISPRGVIEGCIRTLEFESPYIFDSNSPSSTRSKGVSEWHGFFNIWKGKSIKRLNTFPALVSKTSRRCRSGRGNSFARLNQPEDADFCYFKSSWKNFTLSQLRAATNNFSDENLIGKGGYSEVYKGRMLDGQLVAVKWLTRGSQEERITGFLSELGIIAHVNHQNIANLIGYGVEGGFFLVIQLSPRGSLANLLHGSDKNIDWATRYKVAIGTAYGLMYLHEDCQRRTIHRDIKADNILLTEDYEPQICDFGLAKWLPKQWTHHNVSKFEGTFGYFAPEYFMHGIVDEKTDVYAFGVVLLELITGRRALHLQQNLVVWAKQFLDSNNVRELVDPRLGDSYDKEQMNCLISVASLCTQKVPILRPRMSKVVALLKNEKYNSKHCKSFERGSIRRTYSELLDAEEYNSTRYLVGHKEASLCS